MDREEAIKLCDKLGEINLAIWKTSDRRARKMLRAEFKQVFRKLTDAGIKVGRCKEKVNGETVPKFFPNGEAKPKGQQKKNCQFFELYDPRPADVTLKGDCTTRCLCACLGTDDYKAVRAMQDMAARRGGYGAKWNRRGVWDSILVAKGWKYLKIRRGTKRWEIAMAMKGLPETVCTISSRHTAAVRDGKVLDRWESQNGVITALMAPPSGLEQIKSRLRWACVLSE